MSKIIMSKQSFFFIIGMMFINNYSFGQIDSSSNNIKKEKLINTYVEQMPWYKGGDKVLDSIITNNTKYPKKAKKERIRGVGKLRILVDLTGKVQDVKIYKGIREDIDNEAKRLAYLLNDWHPEKLNGKPIEMYTDLKIYFFSDYKWKDEYINKMKPNYKE